MSKNLFPNFLTICSESCFTFFPLIPLPIKIAKSSLLERASGPFSKNLSRGLSIFGMSLSFPIFISINHQRQHSTLWQFLSAFQSLGSCSRPIQGVLRYSMKVLQDEPPFQESNPFALAVF